MFSELNATDRPYHGLTQDHQSKFMLTKTEHPGIANVWKTELFEERYIELTSEPVVEIVVNTPKLTGTHSVEGSIRASVNQEWADFFAQVDPCFVPHKDQESRAKIYIEKLSHLDLYERIISSQLKRKAPIAAAITECLEQGEMFASAERQAKVVQQVCLNVKRLVDQGNLCFLDRLQQAVITRDWQWESAEVLRLLEVEKALVLQLKQAQAQGAAVMRDEVISMIDDWDLPDKARLRLTADINSEQSYIKW